MRSIVFVAVLCVSIFASGQAPRVISLGKVSGRFERMGLQAVPLESGVAILGGYRYAEKECLSDIGLVNASGTEQTLNLKLGYGRNHFAAFGIGSDRALVMGGYGPNDQTLADVELLDFHKGRTETWSPLPNPAELFSAVRVGNEIAVIGGLRNQGTTRTWGSIQRVNLKSGRIGLNPFELAVSRFGQDAVWISGLRKVVIAGGKHVTQVQNGLGKTKAAYQALSSIELWDPMTGKVTDGGHMKFRRDRPKLVALPNGKVLIIGGRSDRETLRSIEIYDPKTHQSKVSASLSAARMAASILPYRNEGLFIAGGWTDEPDAACAVEYLEFKTLRVTTVGRTSLCRAENAMVWLKPDVFALVGGKDAFKGRDPEKYSFATTELFKVTPAP